MNNRGDLSLLGDIFKGYSKEEAQNRGAGLRGIDIRPESQEAMDLFCDFTMYNNNVNLATTINGMMDIEAAKGFFEDEALAMDFIIKPWQANRVGRMQGGLYSVAVDIAGFALASFFTNQAFAPTIEMDLKYIRPVDIGDRLRLIARIVSRGRTLVNIEVKVYSLAQKKLTTTASLSFLRDRS